MAEKKSVRGAEPSRGSRAGFRSVSRSVSPARTATPSVSSTAPWTNSAPSSIGPSGVWCVMMRPPIRPRASSSSTRNPAAVTSRATVRPATPAPMTMTSGPLMTALDADPGP